MPETNGLEATRLIKQELPKTKIIILSQHRSGVFMKEAIAAGADGFAAKDARELIRNFLGRNWQLNAFKRWLEEK